MGDQALWLTEADVVASMNLREAIEALEAGLVLEAQGKAQNMGKTHASWAGGSTLHAVGATFEGAGFVGTKTWAHTEGGATPLLLLWDAQSGALRAVIEAFALGQMRTGGISGVATRWMAATDASSLAMIGSGKQALAQVAAVAAVRPLKDIRIFSPTPERREAFANKVRDHGFGDTVRECTSVAEAVEGAQIVTAATRARTPFLTAAMFTAGAHINAIGAITPERSELEPSVFDRVGLAVADDPAASRRLSSEFQTHFVDDAGWSRVLPLSRIVATAQPRPAGLDLSIFKAMGMGISDLSLGIRLFADAKAAGLGRPIPGVTRVAPRLRDEIKQ